MAPGHPGQEISGPSFAGRCSSATGKVWETSGFSEGSLAFSLFTCAHSRSSSHILPPHPQLRPGPTRILSGPCPEPCSEPSLARPLAICLPLAHPRPWPEPPGPRPVGQTAAPSLAGCVQGTDGLPVDAAAAQKLIHFYLVMVTATLLNGMDYRFGAHFQPEDFPSQA